MSNNCSSITEVRYYCIRILFFVKHLTFRDKYDNKLIYPIKL